MNNMSLCDDCIVLNECDCRECKGKMIRDLNNHELVSFYNEKQALIDELTLKKNILLNELTEIIDVVDERAEAENIRVDEFYMKYETNKTECKFCGELQICVNGVCDDCKHIPD